MRLAISSPVNEVALEGLLWGALFLLPSSAWQLQLSSLWLPGSLSSVSGQDGGGQQGARKGTRTSCISLTLLLCLLFPTPTLSLCFSAAGLSRDGFQSHPSNTLSSGLLRHPSLLACCVSLPAVVLLRFPFPPAGLCGCLLTPEPLGLCSSTSSPGELDRFDLETPKEELLQAAHKCGGSLLSLPS